MNSALTQFLSFVLLSPLKCTSVEALPKKDSEGSSVSEQSTIFQILSPQTSQKKFDLASIKIPPYMLDLFKTVADENGKSRKRVKLAGNVVRSFFNEAMEKSDQDSLQLYFNIGDIGKTENIHKAELRVYKTKARRKSVHIGVNSIHHFHKAEIRSVYGNKLLTSKLVYSGGFGWETFDLTTAVRQWVMTPDTNKGILVIIKKSVPYQAAIDFDTGHHPKHEPILVVYSDENIGNNATTTSSNNNYVPDEMDRYKRQRMRRQVGKSGCKRVDMMVDVSTITAWNLFILQPRLFNAYRCDGKCGAYPSKEEGSRTHHATIQAILSELEPKRLANVKPPCCAPRELEPLTLLLFDIVKGSEIVKLQTLKDMVVTKCGCL